MIKAGNDISIVSHMETFSSALTDALTISLAMASGLWFAGFETKVIATACFIISTVVALVMGAGSFFSRRDQLHDTPENALKEWKRTRELLMNLELSPAQIELAEKEWLREQSQRPLAKPKPAPVSHIAIVALAFLIGGFLPAVCFSLSEESGEGFRVSLVVSGIAFLAFGFIRDKANGLNPIWGSLRALLIGALAVAMSVALAQILTKL